MENLGCRDVMLRSQSLVPFAINLSVSDVYEYGGKECPLFKLKKELQGEIIMKNRQSLLTYVYGSGSSKFRLVHDIVDNLEPKSKNTLVLTCEFIATPYDQFVLTTDISSVYNLRDLTDYQYFIINDMSVISSMFLKDKSNPNWKDWSDIKEYYDILCESICELMEHKMMMCFITDTVKQEVFAEESIWKELEIPRVSIREDGFRVETKELCTKFRDLTQEEMYDKSPKNKLFYCADLVINMDKNQIPCIKKSRTNALPVDHIISNREGFVKHLEALTYKNVFTCK